MRLPCILFGFAVAGRLMVVLASASEFEMLLRSRAETRPGSGVFTTQWRTEVWDSEKTAVIVCDMWDAHHCYNAVQRVTQLAPRMNDVLKKARDAGATIIHAPSSCMAPYEGHPARLRAQRASAADNLPNDISEWCYKIPAEEKGIYPLDQSDGGEDDDPNVHEEWREKLRAMSRNPNAPWTRQIDLLEIDDRDVLTDSGVETWNVLNDRGIDNVILVGVHTNMCILGRPFGLRQMSKNGKNVVLMRDMTDTMYNPAMWPYVNHHTGTDRIVEHIEKFVCPTVLSTDLIGGTAFRFDDDRRPRVACIISEFEYETYKTLPAFAKKHLGKDFKVEYVISDDRDCHDLPGLVDVLASSDLAVLSIWRRTLPIEQLDTLRKFVAAGKPIVAIRTTSHAFVTRDGKSPEGRSTWSDFDDVVLGGHYQGHHGNHVDNGDPATVVWISRSVAEHPVLTNVMRGEFTARSWLYKMKPLADGATPLMFGRVGEDGAKEPVAWTYEPSPGGRVFYTSLGHQDDFKLSQFEQMLTNAVYWAAELDIPTHVERVQ